MDDLLHRLLELFVRAVQPLFDAVEMMFGEGFEMFVEDGLGQLYTLRLRFAVQLGEQTLLQVRTGDAGRVKLLDLRHDRCHLFVAYLQLFLEHQVVHQLFRCAP